MCRQQLNVRAVAAGPVAHCTKDNERGFDSPAPLVTEPGSDTNAELSAAGHTGAVDFGLPIPLKEGRRSIWNADRSEGLVYEPLAIVLFIRRI